MLTDQCCLHQIKELEATRKYSLRTGTVATSGGWRCYSLNRKFDWDRGSEIIKNKK